jgi:hypothetical protein
VVAGAERADLPGPALAGAVADLGRVGAGEPAASSQRSRSAAHRAPLDRVGRARPVRNASSPSSSTVPDAAAPHAVRHGANERPSAGQAVGELSTRSNGVASRRTPQEMSNPTPPGDTTPPSSTSVAATPTDREPVAPVHVRHRVAGLDDARQRRDVGHLLRLRSSAIAGSSCSDANTTPGTRMAPRMSRRHRTGDSATRSSRPCRRRSTRSCAPAVVHPPQGRRPLEVCTGVCQCGLVPPRGRAVRHAPGKVDRW